MATLLAKGADVVVTMDGARREIAGGGLFARDGIIEQVGADEPCPRPPTRCSTCAARSCCRGSSTATTISTRR